MRGDYSALSVMVVEPSSAQVHFVRSCLRSLGCNFVQHCATQAEALGLLRATPPDLVVSAMHLPDGTGVELAEALRREEALQDVLFALLSSEESTRFLEPLRQLGILALLRKPLSREAMQQTLESVCDILSPEELQTEIHLDDIRVLVADDSMTARRFTRRVLRSVGLERIEEATDGRQAAGMLENRTFDLLVTDLHMPEMDGLELITFVRTRSLNPAMPILMVTSEQTAEILAQARVVGADEVLDKPFEPEVVIRVLEALLNRG